MCPIGHIRPIAELAARCSHHPVTPTTSSVEATATPPQAGGEPECQTSSGGRGAGGWEHFLGFGVYVYGCMRRVIVKLVAFWVALVVGGQAAGFVRVLTEMGFGSGSGSWPPRPSEEVWAIEPPVATARGSYEEPFRAEPAAGVLITYIGVSSANVYGVPAMRFLIYNGSAEPLGCIGYEGVCSSPAILIDGINEKAFYCMNGSSEYFIEPGTTAELEVFPHDVDRLPGKREQMSVGYEFRLADGDTVQYFAEPLTLPPAFREAVREDIEKYGN